jgi:osmotically-inducible protein OsmY
MRLATSRYPHRKVAYMGRISDVRAAVQKELASDPLLDASEITVITVKGDVALIGTVRSFPQYLRAAEAARRVTAVNSVHNHLKVVLPSADYRDDAMLTTAANNALVADGTVPASVEAAASSGNLTLTGEVQYTSQSVAAENAVSGLTGVCGVRNKIDLVFDVDQGDVNRLVRKALERSTLVADDSDVVAITSGNTVSLLGHVSTSAEHDAVVSAAWRGRGVLAVIDELEVSGLSNRPCDVPADTQVRLVSCHPVTTRLSRTLLTPTPLQAASMTASCSPQVSIWPVTVIVPSLAATWTSVSPGSSP